MSRFATAAPFTEPARRGRNLAVDRGGCHRRPLLGLGIVAVLGIAAVLGVLVLLVFPGLAQAVVIERVSVSSGGVQGNHDSYRPSISADGRYVAFASQATNLVVGDTNGVADIFVRDLRQGTTTRVSVSSDEVAANGESMFPATSGDGRYVAFMSYATNLVGKDTNSCTDIFVRDLVNGTTTRVSVDHEGMEGKEGSSSPAISHDGRFVAFLSDAANLVSDDDNGLRDAFVHDRSSATTVRVSVGKDATEADGGSTAVAISADGRYVAFSSYATNLVAGDTNNMPDVFVRDLQSGTTTRVSVATGGGQGDSGSEFPSISHDGRFVAFYSSASDLVPGDTNSHMDVFVHDRQDGTTQRVSVDSAGGEFDGDSMFPAISGDGRYVVFDLDADLPPVDTNNLPDVFVHDRQTGMTTGASLSTSDVFGDGCSNEATIDAVGRYIAFRSWATNLVTPDANGSFYDVYAVVNPCTLDFYSLRGSDRMDTAIKISKALSPCALPAESGLVLAPAETFQEALCGAPLAAAYGGPVLLTYKVGLNNGVKAELVRLAPTYVFCVGLPTLVVDQVKAALPTAVVTSITGTNVYVMSRNVANALEFKLGDMSAAVAIITVGTTFPDAISVSPLACFRRWPVILTDKPDGSPLHPSAIGALDDLEITRAIKVGTYATLPSSVTGLSNLSGSDRYVTNRNVANACLAAGGLSFGHTGLATGDKFPDALAAGPYLARGGGILLLSPLNGPLPPVIGEVISANATGIHELSFIAMIEPVISQVRALLL